MKYIGRFLFWILWPLIWFYAPLTRRARAVIIKDAKILLVKNWFGPDYWQLPGGGIKLRETAVNAAIREVKEELQIEVESARSLNKEVALIKQFGLLMRYQFVELTVQKSVLPDKTSMGVVDVVWMPTDALEGVASEVKYAVSLSQGSKVL